MSGKAVHQFSKIVSLATFFLIIAGGLVTSTGSGLSVPDWPLSYGQVFPPMIGGIRFEHSHRVIAGFVGILTLILMILILIQDKRVLIRILGISAFVTIILQAVLGGLTVIYLLPTFISAFHACLGQTLFCLVVSIALFTSDGWSQDSPISANRAGSLQRLLIVTTIFIYCQLIAGSIIRHSAGVTIKYHLILALLIAMHVLFIFFEIAREDALRKILLPHSALLCLLVMLQLFLGFGSYLYIRVLPHSAQSTFSEIAVRTAHQSVGALILATAFTLTLRSMKFVKSA